jgi:hypothetical protein
VNRRRSAEAKGKSSRSGWSSRVRSCSTIGRHACARRVGLEITGTLGVLLRLNRMGLASRGIEEDLRLLDEAGMRSSPDLRRTVIEAGS